jgi:hypothetical protein
METTTMAKEQTKALRIAELLKSGLIVADVAEKAGASKPYVYSVKNGNVTGSRHRKAAKKVIELVAALPARRGRKADPAKRLERIEKYALALVRELAKA